VVPPKYSPYTPLQYKISFSIPTFHLLSIFLLLLIEDGPTGTVEGERALQLGGERGVPRRGVRGRGPRCELSRAPVAPMQGEGAHERQPLRAVLDCPQRTALRLSSPITVLMQGAKITPFLPHRLPL
jgi:hypothetical protein